MVYQNEIIMVIFMKLMNNIINLSNPLLTDEAKEEMDNTMYAPMDPEDRSLLIYIIHY